MSITLPTSAAEHSTSTDNHQTEQRVVPAVPPQPIVPGQQYLNLPRSSETFLISPVLPAGGSMLLYGDPKVGKSFAGLQLANALVTASDWFGFRVPCSCRVVYIQLDTPRSLWAERVASLRERGLHTDAILFADRETLNTWPFDILNPAHQVLLAQALAEVKADCVIIDTLRECHRGDENDASDMQNVVSSLVAATQPAALILIAHGRKADPDRQSSLINDNRGSNYVVGAVDAIAHMSKEGIEIGGRAVEQVSISLSRQDDGTWILADRDRVKQLARELLMGDAAVPLREKARILAASTGKDPAACLTILHRLLRAHE